MTMALLAGDIDAVTRLHKNGYKFNDFDLFTAATNGGNLDVFKYLRENSAILSTEYSFAMYNLLIMDDALDMLKYALKHDIGEVHPGLCTVAANGHAEVLACFLGHGCPYNADELLEAAKEDDTSMAVLRDYGIGLK